MISLKYYTSTYTNLALLHIATEINFEKVFDILKSFDANDFGDNDGRNQRTLGTRPRALQQALC